jgi:hypothetical protein
MSIEKRYFTSDLASLAYASSSFLDGDALDIGGDAVRATEVEHLLGGRMPPMSEPERLRLPNRRPKGATTRETRRCRHG